METEKKTLKEIFEKLSTSHLSGERIIAAFVTSFMLGYALQLIKNPIFYDLNEYYNSINFTSFWTITIFLGVALCFFTFVLKLKSLIPRALIIVSTLLSTIYATSYNTIDAYYIIGLVIVDLIVVMWCVKDDKLEISKIDVSYKMCFIIACVLFLSTTVLFSYLTSLRYQNFYNATFDFGIFTQMYENMAVTGLPLTTVERSVEMSHFGVHFSPIYYLLLPGYMIFRSPIYLICAQTFVVCVGIFPIFLICKKLELSGKVTLIFEIIYAFYPCLLNGCFYDFHENKMLTTIILFLLYFILCEKNIPTIIMSLLLLSVKEDAAIYLIVIAIYVLINKKKKLIGAIMLALAVVYFIIAQRVVASLGSEGVMMWRLSDYFVNEKEGFFSVFKSILFDMGYLIKMMFTADKFPFIIWMFLPLMFTPFMQKKISALILLLPIIPINLMQSWPYQYDIDYQYTYGVAALVIFLAILGIKNMKTNAKRVALLMSVIVCVTVFAHLVQPKIKRNLSYEESYKNVTESIEETLHNKIKREDSVTANHHIAPHLYFVRELYTVPEYYKEIEQTDYFVLDTRDEENTQKMKEVMRDDYVCVGRTSFVEIHKKK
ncbi:MAG: DUF2079 domain-containing protein [Ruminococcus sp.]|nr:DUF2079 domain-containing protein [Ruminococcus sp.]